MAEINSKNALGMMVSSEMIESFKKGEMKRYTVELNDDTFSELLEMLDDGIVVMSDEIPEEGIGCYFYNNGEFPYMLRRWLEYLVFSDGKEQIPAKIKYTMTRVKERFNFDSNDEAVNDENGSCCVWNIIFGLDFSPES